jgi:phytoene desaturase
MTQPRAVVIGSGFGGMALAVRLQAAGVKTTIVEKRECTRTKASRSMPAPQC